MYLKILMFQTFCLCLVSSNLQSQTLKKGDIRNNLGSYYTVGVNGFDAVNDLNSPNYTSPLFQTGVKYIFILNPLLSLKVGGILGIKLKGKSYYNPQTGFYTTNPPSVDYTNSGRNMFYLGMPVSFAFSLRNVPLQFEAGLEFRYWAPSGSLTSGFDYLDSRKEIGYTGGVFYKFKSENLIGLRYYHSLNPFYNTMVQGIVADPDKPLKYYNHYLVLGFEFSLFKPKMN